MSLLRVIIVSMVTLWAVSGYVSAQSTLSLWISPGSVMSIDNYTMTLYSLSPNGYTTLGISKGENQTVTIVGPNSEVSVDGYSLLVDSWIITNSTSYVHVVLSGSYVPAGETMRVGRLSLKLLSVNAKNATLLINGEKRTVAGSVDVDGYRLTVVPMPELFNGYISVNRTEEVDGLRLDVLGEVIVPEGSSLLIGVRLKVNNRTYRVPIGQYIKVSRHLIRVTSVSDLYAGVEVRGYGAYLYLRGPGREVTVPAETMIYERGYTVEVGEPKEGAVDVEIVGRERYKALLTPGQGLSCDDMTVGVLGIINRSTPEIKLVLIGNSTESHAKPIVITRWLNVSIRAPQVVTAGEPFNLTVELHNSGDLPIKSLTVTIPRAANVRVSPGTMELSDIEPGERKVMRFKVTVLRSGPVTLGPIDVITTYLDGKKLNVSSNRLTVNALAPKPRLIVEVRAGNGTVGTILPVKVSVKNEGNFTVNFNLTLSVPDDSAIMANNFSMYGRWLWRRGSVKADGTVNYTVFIVPTKAGNYRITAIAESYGRTFSGFSKVRVSGVKPKVEVVKEKCKPEVITKVIRYSGSTERSHGNWKMEVLVGLAFVAGVGFVLLLAWIVAKLEERD